MSWAPAILACALFFLSAVPAFAKANLQSEHGPNLDKADFPLRYKFYKTTNVEWKKSTYSQRENFLTQWHANLEHQRKVDRQKAREEKAIARQESRQRKEAKKREEEKKKRFAAIEKQAWKEDRRREKEVADYVRDQERRVRDLRRSQKEGR